MPRERSGSFRYHIVVARRAIGRDVRVRRQAHSGHAGEAAYRVAIGRGCGMTHPAIFNRVIGTGYMGAIDKLHARVGGCGRTMATRTCRSGCSDRIVPGGAHGPGS